MNWGAAMSTSLPLCQIAITCADMARSRWWYQRAMGFATSGVLEPMSPPELSLTQGLPGVVLGVSWLLDRRKVQLELFDFKSPSTRRMPADWNAADIGYASYGVHTVDFDAALARILRVGGRPLTAPLGSRGTRRVCVADPDGVLVELMEEDPLGASSGGVVLPHVPVSIRSITYSVYDLERARRLWVETFGFPEVDGRPLHAPEHEELWGLKGAQRDAVLVRAGEVLVELVRYRTPVPRPRPAGQWIADQGVSHVAIRPASEPQFDELHARATAAGYPGNWKPWDFGGAKAVYLNDDQGFTCEMLWCSASEEHRFGLVPDADAVPG
jgi:catechol 2,3-dioxygenase-like lactoylglutathione lyase family enzyme